MKFKSLCDASLFFFLHPLMIKAVAEVNYYCHENNLPLTITSTVSTLEEDIALNRVSDSHRTKRAVDIRTKDWTSDDINRFLSHFNRLYRNIGAISRADGQARFAVYHSNSNGPGNHIHLSLAKRYAIEYEPDL